MDNRQETGRRGEELACRYLTELGHTVLARNWRSGHLEIDLVSLSDDGIHFVEVKTRRPPLQAEPQDNVTGKKQNRICKAANAFLNKVDIPYVRDAECHFDVVAVTLEETGPRVVYIPDAYYPIFV